MNEKGVRVVLDADAVLRVGLLLKPTDRRGPAGGLGDEGGPPAPTASRASSLSPPADSLLISAASQLNANELDLKSS